MSTPIKWSFREVLGRRHLFKQHPYYKSAWFEHSLYEGLHLSMLKIRSHGIARALVNEISRHLGR